jgi:hypothetical protein
VTEAQAVEAILEAFNTGWVAKHPDIPVVFDDESFNAPDTWCRLTIVHSVREQMSMGPAGSRRWRHRGNIAAQIFTPVNIGRQLRSQLADDVRSILEGISIVIGNDQIATQSGSTRENKTDGRWAQSTVVVAMWWTQVR